MTNTELKLIARKLVEQHAHKELTDGFKPAGLHDYRDEKGMLLYIRIRLKNPAGDKWIRPFYFDSQTQQWKMSEPRFEANKKPLYHLPNVTTTPHVEIWIVEGETKVEALEKFGFVATTSGGSTSASSVNWEPLRGRQIIIWRDYDQSGEQYANSLIPLLQSLDCTIRHIDVNQLNLPDSGDVINWLQLNLNCISSNLI